MLEWFDQNLVSTILEPTVILAVFALGIILMAFGICILATA
jgi:hypothetical protein